MTSKFRKMFTIKRSEIVCGIRSFIELINSFGDFEDFEDCSWRLPRNIFKMMIYIFLSSILIGHLFMLLTNISMYNIYVDEIRAKGEPALPSDIEVKQIPNEQNAALYLKDAIENHFVEYYDFIALIKIPYIEIDSNLDLLTVSRLKSSAFDRCILQSWLNANKKTIELIKQAESYSQAEFKVKRDSEFGWDHIFDNCRIYSTLIELLKRNIYIAIVENDKQRAFENYKILTDLSRFFENEMTTEACWDAFAINYSAREVLYQIFANLILTPEEIDFAYDCYIKTFYAINIRNFIIARRYEILNEANRLNSHIDLSLYSNLRFGEYFSHTINEFINKSIGEANILLKLVSFQTELLELIDKPYSYLEIKDELNRLADKTKFEDGIQYSILYFSGILELRSYYNDLALNRIIHTKLAIKKFQNEYGRIPESLAELVETGILDRIPINPITGFELNYEVINGKYRVYCPQSNDILNKLAYGYDEDELDLALNDDIEWESYEDYYE